MLSRLKPGLQRKIRRGNLPLRAPSETVLDPGHVVTWNWRTLNQAESFDGFVHALALAASPCGFDANQG